MWCFQWGGFKWKFIAVTVLVLAKVYFSFSSETGREIHFGDREYQLDFYNEQISAFKNGLDMRPPKISQFNPDPKMTIGTGQGQGRQMPSPEQIAQICAMAMQLIAAGQATQAEIQQLCQMMGGMMPAAMAGAVGSASATGSDVSAMGLKDVVAILGLAIGAKIFLILAGYLLTRLATTENRRVTIMDRYEQDQDVLQSIYSISNRRRRQNCKNWGSGVGSASVTSSGCKLHHFHDNLFGHDNGEGYGGNYKKKKIHLLSHRNDLDLDDLYDPYDKDWYEYIWSGLRKLVFGS